MKTTAIIFLISMVLKPYSYSQGVYKTANDLLNNTYCLTSNSIDKISINSGSIFKGSVVNIKIGNKKQQLSKNEYYGYRDENNVVYRFFENQTYELLNPKEKIFIYRKKVLGGPKGNFPMYKYYFSLTPESKLIELSIHNIKTSFKEDKKLLEKIDLHFKNDVELIEYDSFNKKFKLNNVLG
jgi:hypothetical protein